MAWPLLVQNALIWIGARVGVSTAAPTIAKASTVVMTFFGVKTGTELAGKAFGYGLWAQGVAMFGEFIFEEAVQSAGMGVFIARGTGDPDTMQAALDRYKFTVQSAINYHEGPGVVNILNYAAFTSFFRAAEQAITSYEELIASVRERELKSKLSRSQIEEFYKEGTIIETKARELLGEKYYLPTDVDLIINNWDSELLAGDRELTKAEAERLRKAGLITDGDYKNYLLSLGYEEPQAQLFLELLISKMETKTRELSESQWAKVYKKGDITRDQYKSQIQALGYSAPNSEYLAKVRDSEMPIPEKKIRELTKTDVIRLLKSKLIPEADAKGRLYKAGFSEKDINLLIQEAMTLPAEPGS